MKLSWASLPCVTFKIENVLSLAEGLQSIFLFTIFNTTITCFIEKSYTLFFKVYHSPIYLPKPSKRFVKKFYISFSLLRSLNNIFYQLYSCPIFSKLLNNFNNSMKIYLFLHVCIYACVCVCMCAHDSAQRCLWTYMSVSICKVSWSTHKLLVTQIASHQILGRILSKLSPQ